MESHEIVGSVMRGETDPESVKIDVDIESDKLPDDPRLYLTFENGGDHFIVAFPLKEIFRAIEKEMLN
jgi:hypothetical protein